MTAVDRLNPPPLTEELSPLAVFVCPPLTEAHTPLAVLKAEVDRPQSPELSELHLSPGTKPGKSEGVEKVDIVAERGLAREPRAGQGERGEEQTGY